MQTKELKICKDGRIWGQNNKEAGSHLGISYISPITKKYNYYVRKGHNPNSIGRPFKKGCTSWCKGTKGVVKSWNKGIGGPALYSLEFMNKLRELVRERDGYKCQECGCSQIECTEKLSVHHIDYNKKNDNTKNLISLCRPCHLKTQTNREYWRKRYTNG